MGSHTLSVNIVSAPACVGENNFHRMLVDERRGTVTSLNDDVYPSDFLPFDMNISRVPLTIDKTPPTPIGTAVPSLGSGVRSSCLVGIPPRSEETSRLADCPTAGQDSTPKLLLAIGVNDELETTPNS
ncbi:hypothetical protein MPTK1_4g02465 [Marchantia polymorpha subsp. ruderalis]